MTRAWIKKSTAAGCIAILMATIGLAGCVSNPDGSKKAGTDLGAIVGGVIGSQFGSGGGKMAATLFGVAAGAFIGHEIAKALTKEDIEEMNEATNRALNSEDETASETWSNEESGNSGTVVANQAYSPQDSSSGLCRDFTQTVTLADGTEEEATTTACQQADGSWSMIG